jgi:threonine dehydratase
LESQSMVSSADVRKAAAVIKGSVIRTPLVYSPTFSKLTGAEIYLKLENLQETGSFKLRGATFKILSELDRIGKDGVVAASAGNHAQGVALAATRAGLHSTVVMPEWASISKQEGTRGYGGEVILEGQSIPDCIRKAEDLAKAGKTFIHPYDDPGIIAGQGTIALEILEDLPDPDLIIVPIGGGGLISGIACAAKEIRPEVRVVGVQAAACPSAVIALEKGKRVVVEAEKSIADGITVKQVGEIPFQIIREKVDEIVLVSEDGIAEAVLMLLERKKMLAEGAGSVPVAAIFSGAVSIPPGGKAVLVISGGNMDSPLLDRVIRRGLSRNGRIMRLTICLDDVPGSLASLLAVVAKTKANVLHIYHDRGTGNLSIYQSLVELELEARNFEHTREISEALKAAGYTVELRKTGE